MSTTGTALEILSVERLAAMVRAVDVPFIGLRADGAILSWNAAAERVFGRAERDALGRSFSEVCLPKALPAGREAVQRAQGGETVRFEAVLARKKAPATALCITVTPVKNDDGSVTLLSVIVNPMPRGARATERRAARDAHKPSPQEFARLVAHEIHSPLASILGFGELLVSRYSGQLGPQADEWLGFISVSVKKARAMMTNLSAYAAIGADERAPETRRRRRERRVGP